MSPTSILIDPDTNVNLFQINEFLARICELKSLVIFQVLKQGACAIVGCAQSLFSLHCFLNVMKTKFKPK
jgi:hypothetical protein